MATADAPPLAVHPGGTAAMVGLAVAWLAAPFLGACAVGLRRVERLALEQVRP